MNDEVINIEISETIELVQVLVNEESPDQVSIIVTEAFEVVNVEVVEGGEAVAATSYEAGEQINSHTPVALIGKKIYKFDNTIPLHQFAFIGFTKTSGNAGELIEVEEKLLSLSGWGLLPNQHYMAGEGGVIQTVATNGFTKVIGFAQDANTMLIIKDYTTILKQ